MNFMNIALKEAKLAFEKDEVPVGAIIVENGKIIAKAHNQNRILSDPTAHAEILALRQAALTKKTHRLDNCDIYVTLEPCPMCAFAISLARVRKIYFATSDEKFGAIENGPKLFNQPSCFHKPEIYSGFSQEESKNLLKQFFQTKR